MKANEQRRLLVLRDGSEAIAVAVKRMWPKAVQQECLVHAHSNLRDKLRRRDRADLDLRFKALREAQGEFAGLPPSRRPLNAQHHIFDHQPD